MNEKEQLDRIMHSLIMKGKLSVQEGQKYLNLLDIHTVSEVKEKITSDLRRGKARV